MPTATITIPVDVATAQAVAERPPEEQRKLELLLGLRLEDLLASPGRPLKDIMDEIGQKAEARGLTPEILEALLHDE